MRYVERNLKVKFLLLLVGSITLLVSFGGGNYSFYDMMISSYSYSCTIIILIAVLLFNTIDIINDLNNNSLVLCRFKGYKDYFKTLVKITINSNFKLILLFLLLNVAAAIIGCLNNYVLPNSIYDINFLIIWCYYTIKLFIILFIISILEILIYCLWQNIGSYIFFGILMICPLFTVYKENFVISSIFNFPINYISYLSLLNYASFFYDLMAFLTYISGLIIVIIIIYEYIMKRKKDIIK